jgi:hypothetical protein
MSSKNLLLDWESWVTLPVYALVFVMLVFPNVSALFYVRMFLLAAIAATVVLAIVKTGRAGLHPTIALWTYSLSALSFLFVLEGFFAGAPGAAKTISVYVVFPMIYALMIAGVRNDRVLSGLFKTLTVSTICIAIYSLVYLLIQTKILPESNVFNLISFDWDWQAFGLHDEYIGMTFPGLTSLAFLVPFVLAALVTCTPRAEAPSFRRAWLWTAAFLSLVSVLISARRALYLVTLTAPFLALVFLSFQPMPQRRSSRKALVRVTAAGVLAIMISLVSLNVIYGVTLSGLADRFSMGFNFSPTAEDTGTTERRVQFHALVEGWMANPILGAGHGAPAFGSIRSEERPWLYELYYLALLYQTGLVGFTAYAAGIFWIYWMGVRVIRAGGQLSALMVACLVGMSSFLIANATNPYLAGLDGMWAIFLPLALINFWLLQHPAPRRSSSLRFASA